MIYKLLATQEWDQARKAGRYEGSAVDRRDGFIHFSGRGQVVETARRVFAGQRGLTLLVVDPDRLGSELHEDVAVPDAVAALLVPPGLT